MKTTNLAPIDIGEAYDRICDLFGAEKFKGNQSQRNVFARNFVRYSPVSIMTAAAEIYDETGVTYRLPTPMVLRARIKTDGAMVEESCESCDGGRVTWQIRIAPGRYFNYLAGPYSGSLSARCTCTAGQRLTVGMINRDEALLILEKAEKMGYITFEETTTRTYLPSEAHRRRIERQRPKKSDAGVKATKHFKRPSRTGKTGQVTPEQIEETRDLLAEIEKENKKSGAQKK